MQRRFIYVALVLGLLVVGGGATAYELFLRGDQVAPLSLSATASPAGASASQPAGGEATASPSAAATSDATPGSTGTATATSLAGRWVVAENSVAGYRVREKLGGLPAESDAVGRATAVTGEVDLAADGGGLVAQKGSFTVDLTQLTSDDGRRDRRLRSIGLETDAYPNATFVAQSVAVPAEALTGAIVDLDLVGDLSLHGVTKSVTIPAQARLVDGRIEIAGSLDFPFADFNIVPPDIAGFVTVHDTGTMEFKLVLERAG